MKIFISHKFRGVDKAILKNELSFIMDILEYSGNQTFNYFRDVQKWNSQELPPGEVITAAFKEIEKCDAILCFINNEESSEGMFLEFGFAKALEKKTILLINNKYSKPTLEAISDKVIKFRDFPDVTELLKDL
jgi:nucleoside 2-deoxyribosyltransferase